jgi:predicted nucleotidyltransferase component of viral defense system
MEDLRLNCLLENTKNVLIKLTQYEYMKNFVLVGGSALALHLCHRLSEDLDFFTYDDSFDLETIKKIINMFKNKEIVNITNTQVDVFLEGVKVTFFNAKWSFLKPYEVKKMNVASLNQIAIMKTNTIFLRAKHRDYYDLYFLSKKIGLKKIYDLSKEILDGINFKLFVGALLYIDDIEDENINHLCPVEKLTLGEIRSFFEEQLKSYIS